MIRWIPYTFVRTVIFFIAGIVTAFHNPNGLPENLVIGAAVLLTLLYFPVVLFRRWFHWFNPGWLALPLVFVLGYAQLLLQTESRNANHIIHNTEQVAYYRVVMTSFAEQRAQSWRMEARLDAVYTTEWKAKKGKVMLYFSKEGFPHPFEYGDVLLVRGQPRVPDPAYNPGQFDYRNYLSLRNIYHLHFIRKGDALKIGYAPDNFFRRFAYQARSRAEKVLNLHVDGERERAIASALVLGVTDGLDNELLNAYSATGTMHILAVSGLHISIIYLILLRIFSPLSRVRGAGWLVAFISLVLLWLYAVVTGLSPSVLRAVMMFSFFAVARPAARSTNVYNTLAVSAFCLLLFDPFLIFSVGFQLSYLAVLGIVYIYPRILRLWEPQRVITVEIWKLVAVSAAAQLATFPLCLLYFHQFPNYFLISNLLVVPLSFVILIAGLILLLVSFLHIMAAVVGFCLEWVIRLLNSIVFTMEDLPFALTEEIYVSAWQSMLLVLLIVFVLALLEVKKFRYLVFCFAITCMFVALQWMHFCRDVDIQKLIVYHVGGHSAIDLIDKGQAWFVADASLKADARLLRYHVLPHRIIAGVKKEYTGAGMFEFDGGRLILWKGRTLLQLRDHNYSVPTDLKVDWMVVGNNAVQDIGKMAQRIRCRMIILDTSNSFFYATRFLEAAKLYKLEVHSVLHQGAFIAEIETGIHEVH